MNTLYKSKTGEVRDYQGWEQEALEFYRKLDTDQDVPVKQPADWFKRWTKTLGLEAL